MNSGLKVMGRTRHRTFTQLFSDNFTRANENPLSDGGNWTQFITTDSALEIVSNVVQGTTTGACSRLLTGVTLNANQYMMATFGTAGGTGPGRQVWVRSVSSATQNGYEFFAASGQNSVLLLVAYIAGVSTTLASYSVALSNGDSIGLGVYGYTLYCYHNGVLLGSTLDTASSAASGQPGIRINETPSANSATWSNFVAGNFSPL